jgi:TetR/AcrR family transcriptional regulator, regulator of autoinduction and epiphytic fitness
VFARFGFRKASMDEVARAAQVSRQGLYLHFPTKEDLFRATVEHLLRGALSQASNALADPALELDARLIHAFDHWVGRFVGMFGGPAVDLLEASMQLVQPVVNEHEERFLVVVAEALRTSGLGKVYKSRGLSPQDLAQVLYSSARGFKASASSREQFAALFGLTVRALCQAPQENR